MAPKGNSDNGNGHTLRQLVFVIVGVGAAAIMAGVGYILHSIDTRLEKMSDALITIRSDVAGIQTTQASRTEQLNYMRQELDSLTSEQRNIKRLMQSPKGNL